MTDPPGKNIFSLEWDDVQDYFAEQRINEKHEHNFYGCPECEDCATHAFLKTSLIENPTNLYRRLWHTIQQDLNE